MELKQHLIHRKYKKCEARNQITVGDDYSIPDGKSDIGSVLQKKSELQIEEVHTEKGKIRIRGNLKIWVLYLTERSSKVVDCLEMKFPVDEILYMEGAQSGDNLKLDWTIEDLRITIIHPGKLSVRVLLNLYGSITGTQSYLVSENVEGNENICTKTETYTFAEPVFERNENYRIRDEVSLPVSKPNVQNLLWKDLQLRGMELRMQEGRIAIKGEVLLFGVYEGEEDSSAIQWLEQSIPFQGTLEINGLTPEMVGVLESEIAHQEVEVKPDYDGEMRMFQIEMLLNIHLHIYEERTAPVLKDAYSTKEQLNLLSEEITYEKLRMCNQAKCRISGKEKVEQELKVLQILGSQAQILNKQVKMTEQGLLCEGLMEAQIFYVTDSDRRPFDSIVITIPYMQLVEIPNIRKDDSWKVSEKLDQIFITMSDSHVIEVRGVIYFDACVMQQVKMQNVMEVSGEPYDIESYKKRPGMRIHFVQPGENLWSIAKQNLTTMDEIKTLNDLTADDVSQGQKLLLLKPRSGTMIV